MMRSAMIAAMLTGCTPVESMPETAGRCVAERGQRLIGQVHSSELEAQARTLTDARSVRVIRPNQAVTMDYREDRVNVELDARGRVVAIRCG